MDTSACRSSIPMPSVGRKSSEAVDNAKTFAGPLGVVGYGVLREVIRVGVGAVSSMRLRYVVEPRRR